MKVKATRIKNKIFFLSLITHFVIRSREAGIPIHSLWDYKLA